MNESTKNYQKVKKIFEDYGEETKFTLGQNLTTNKYLPGNVFLIKTGQARLITKIDGRQTTIIKLSQGNLVGAASLMTNNPCEEIRASGELTAFRLSDNDFLSFYKNNSDFKSFFESKIWEAELLFLLKRFENTNINNQLDSKKFLNFIYESSVLITPTKSEIKAALEKNKRLFINPFNKNSDLDIEIKSLKQFENFEQQINNFPMRIYYLQNLNYKEGIKNKKSLSSIKNSKINREKIAPPFPEVSILENFEENNNFFVQANGKLESTLACFKMLSKVLNFPFRTESIEKSLKDFINRNKTITLKVCGEVATYHGLQVNISKVNYENCSRLKTPAFMKWKGAIAIVLQSNKEGIKIALPEEGFIKLKTSEFKEVFNDGIEILTFEKTNSTLRKVFGFSWFIPFLKNYKLVLFQILIAGVVIQLLSLANPLLIQVIIDKVISQGSLDTLQILGIGILFITLMEGILNSLKSFLLAETTSRIDQRLSAEIIDHLLGLPLNFFEGRQTGELSSRLAELEKIRTFLTSQALTTILDGLFSVIYILIMILYSLKLTVLSLIVLPIQIILTYIGGPLFKRQSRSVAVANAQTQSHIIEILNGIETVKSQNVETSSRLKWQELYSRYINQSFQKNLTGITFSQSSQVLQKISQLMILWVGAGMVLAGSITLGQLIAFRIISSYVTQPLLRLSNIWQDLQELKVSFERLADIIDYPKEMNDVEKSKILMPKIEKFITFKNVSFKFKKEQNLILKNINLSFKTNNFIGIVGQSGSGKSTLMKLLPRLYSPNEGKVLIDGYDLDKVELKSLREQIGIVPQNPILFKGTIRDNISLSNPEISQEKIIDAAKLANAHEFIMELPFGYSTSINERGGTLSGGQKQRITIARSLLTKPKILILDEATSALDYETEKKICENLVNLKFNMTVFFITHRLSAIRNADSILVLNEGLVDEFGTHEELIKKRGRYYAFLNNHKEK